MIPSDQRPDWCRRSREIATPEEEAALLTEILQAGQDQWRALGELVLDGRCRSVLRCAALDQFVKQAPDDSEGFLEKLVSPLQEFNEDVRLAAYQWLADLKAQAVDRGLRDPHTSEAWEEQLRNDPSPRVRWLALLSA